MKSISFLAILLLLVSANAKGGDIILWVNSFQVNCVGVGPMKCLLVQKGDTLVPQQWQNFYSKIEGFNYEPGYIYKLRVREENLVDVPADASSIKYTLVEMLSKEADFTQSVAGTWQAIMLEGTAIVIPEGRGAIHPPTISISLVDRSISGTDGCNRMRGQIKNISDTEIEFGAIAGTRMMCPDMSIPQQVNKLLNEVKGYRLDNRGLKFLDERGTELISFVRIIDPETIISGTWELQKLNDQLVKLKGECPQMEIDKEQMSYSGTDGCNHFRGQIRNLNNEEVEFSPAAGTRRMCKKMKIAGAFNRAIGQVKYYELTGEKLELKDANRITLLTMKRVR
ncbi:MAG: META domain-containing protein [Mangrovibacterium sp.]